MKQNYNFGNACTEVISIPFLEERTIDDVFTVELWHKSNSASSRDSLVVADWDSDYIDHWLEYSSLRHRFRYGGALSTITSVPVSLGMYVTQEINLLSDGVAEVNNEYTATNN
ncbi:MAG: hypothetical protein PQJ44_05195, partial [Sphaerochaetaceae bacterium]|nr:hypothetical protein [Sphaerochaetaceae bacterium]